MNSNKSFLLQSCSTNERMTAYHLFCICCSRLSDKKKSAINNFKVVKVPNENHGDEQTTTFMLIGTAPVYIKCTLPSPSLSGLLNGL